MLLTKDVQLMILISFTIHARHCPARCELPHPCAWQAKQAGRWRSDERWLATIAACSDKAGGQFWQRLDPHCVAVTQARGQRSSGFTCGSVLTRWKVASLKRWYSLTKGLRCRNTEGTNVCLALDQLTYMCRVVGVWS